MFSSRKSFEVVSVFVCLAALEAGCAGDSGFEPSAEVKATAGTYTLVRANGAALPVPAGNTEGACPRSMYGGSMVLVEGGGYTLSLPLRAECPMPGGGTNTVTGSADESGSWTISGGKLTLNPVGARITDANSIALVGNTIELSVQFEWAGPSPKMMLVLQK